MKQTKAELQQEIEALKAKLNAQSGLTPPRKPLNPPTNNTFVHCIGTKINTREELITHNDDRANENTTEYSNDSVTIGFTDIKIWNVAKQQYIPVSQDPDKFIITVSGDYKTAWAEFWARWSTYCKQRFGFKIAIEATNDF